VPIRLNVLGLDVLERVGLRWRLRLSLSGGLELGGSRGGLASGRLARAFRLGRCLLAHTRACCGVRRASGGTAFGREPRRGSFSGVHGNGLKDAEESEDDVDDDDRNDQADQSSHGAPPADPAARRGGQSGAGSLAAVLQERPGRSRARGELPERSMLRAFRAHDEAPQRKRSGGRTATRGASADVYRAQRRARNSTTWRMASGEESREEAAGSA
jgi:hypothetical protein